MSRLRHTPRPTALACLAAVMLSTACTTAGTGGDGPTDDGVETVRVAPDYLPNTNYIGVYVAQQLGWYAEAGVAVEVLPYAETPPEVLLTNDEAEFGVTSQAYIAYSRAGGSDVQQVFANVARNQYAISMRADRDDLTRPNALDGTTYAGFGSPDEGPALSYVIQADGGRGDFETVVLSTTAYEAVYAGQADFTWSVRTWDGVLAELTDRPLKYFEFDDYGFPRQYSTAIAASQGWLADNPDTARAFLAATQRGYAYAAENPGEAADLMLAAEPDALANPEQVRASAALLADEDYYTDGSRLPIGTIDADVWTGYGSFLIEQGLLTDAEGAEVTEDPDWSQFWTNEYLPQE